MRVIGLVISDGVGYRNFILSDFITEASLKFTKVIIYSALPISYYKSLDTKDNNISIEELEVFVEPKKTWFFRKIKEVAHLFKHKDFYGIKDTLKQGYPKRYSKRSFIVKVAYFIAKLFHTEKAIHFFEWIQFATIKNHSITKNYTTLLSKDLPDILFFTHQRPPYLAPMLFTAQSLKIKTCSFIFSWDNLASKGRMLGNFDSYLVWSELMKKELLHFYPYTNKEKVQVVGTPQFEPYVLDRYAINKEVFFNKFNLDPAKKVISYSCADNAIGKNDQYHIEAIVAFIKQRPELKLQLLVRTSPAEDGLRFKEIEKRFPFIHWNYPKWIMARSNHSEAWSQRIPTIEDVIDLKATLTFADVNINMCSTMSLDFMLFDKPVINTVFGNEENDLYNDQRFLNYDHYKYVINSKAVTIAKNEEELHEQLREALEFPMLRKQYRKELLALEIGKPLEETSKRIVNELGNFFK